ncbi:homing endonuclease [Paramecium bursaria Chlorella virus NYs1]|uniref:GIY-YIG catalytic domain-containing endonuclease n=1 Tax=Paramecium bursaria Chlorella virus NYs1 TaxID=83442 RepID=M1HH69_9PHYC|nr:homing endonuclease [Paramecium bursaria Chlorella virus AR158]YP_009665268.1 homing endonuclease [Paramecium bursaria Chlorella virus NYs1]ABU43703.1 hypothetical protein AR158_C157R [Paramecium bursaria Chlorella virus AR158]AGE54103.1 GIY-YIG catalytic domain-containing endonuclease [Paramecium bursaria Chlorella virus IL-5-2s1]AGE58623.1 GIY-YIG catalytic domain-containing endonuclease [Paramecium bursaria Chlorella virus NYs1]
MANYLVYALFIESQYLYMSDEKELVFEYESNKNKYLYIGYTNNFTKRMWTHSKNTENEEYTSSKKLYNCIRKYGFDTFKKVILRDKLTREEAKDEEILRIAKYNSFKNGLNSTKGGDGGATHSGSEHASSYPIKLLNLTSKEELFFDWVGEAAEYIDTDPHNIYQIFRDTNSSRQTFSKKHNAWFTAKKTTDDTEWMYDMLPITEEIKRSIIMLNIDTCESLKFTGIVDAANHFNIFAGRISGVLAESSHHKQVYIDKDRYDVQYDPPERPWNYDILPKEYPIIGFDQDYTNENPIFRFDSATDASDKTGIQQSHISDCARHNRWHAGKLNGKQIRWEFENIDKRNAQKERPKMIGAVYYINDDGHKILFTTMKRASEETCGKHRPRTHHLYIKASAESHPDFKIPCKNGLIWYYDK